MMEISEVLVVDLELGRSLVHNLVVRLQEICILEGAQHQIKMNK